MNFWQGEHGGIVHSAEWEINDLLMTTWHSYMDTQHQNQQFSCLTKWQLGLTGPSAFILSFQPSISTLPNSFSELKRQINNGTWRFGLGQCEKFTSVMSRWDLKLYLPNPIIHFYKEFFYNEESCSVKTTVQVLKNLKIPQACPWNTITWNFMWYS